MNDLELTGKAVDKLNSLKADKTNTYNKSEIDYKLNQKGNVKKSTRILTLNDVENTPISEVVSFGGLLIRTDDKVEFSCRIETKTPISKGKIHIFENIPIGYRLSSLYDNTSWNVPLKLSRNQDPKLFDATAFAERKIGNEPGNKIVLWCANNGNFYLQGEWYTDDPFPS